MTAARIDILYSRWAGSAFAWESLSMPSDEALRTLLTRIRRAPHQVGFQQGDGWVDVMAMMPGVLDDGGNAVFAPMATIWSGLDMAGVKTARQSLKSVGWSPAELLKGD